MDGIQEIPRRKLQMSNLEDKITTTSSLLLFL